VREDSHCKELLLEAMVSELFRCFIYWVDLY
jgi:hypothetical protein